MVLSLHTILYRSMADTSKPDVVLNPVPIFFAPPDTEEVPIEPGNRTPCVPVGETPNSTKKFMSKRSKVTRVSRITRRSRKLTRVYHPFHLSSNDRIGFRKDALSLSPFKKAAKPLARRTRLNFFSHLCYPCIILWGFMLQLSLMSEFRYFKDLNA